LRQESLFQHLSIVYEEWMVTGCLELGPTFHGIPRKEVGAGELFAEGKEMGALPTPGRPQELKDSSGARVGIEERWPIIQPPGEEHGAFIRCRLAEGIVAEIQPGEGESGHTAR
jgi:hypothetical protein